MFSLLVELSIRRLQALVAVLQAEALGSGATGTCRAYTASSQRAGSPAQAVERFWGGGEAELVSEALCRYTSGRPHRLSMLSVCNPIICSHKMAGSLRPSATPDLGGFDVSDLYLCSSEWSHSPSACIKPDLLRPSPERIVFQRQERQHLVTIKSSWTQKNSVGKFLILISQLNQKNPSFTSAVVKASCRALYRTNSSRCFLW